MLKNRKKILKVLKKIIQTYPKFFLIGIFSFFLFVIILWLLSGQSSKNTLGEFQAVAQKKILSQDALQGEMFFGKGIDDKDFKKVFISKIAKAEKSLHLAMYSIEDEEIISFLQEKKNQGVDVRIVVPLRKERQHSITFASTNLDIIEVGEPSQDDAEYQESPAGFMHHKFIIIDAGTPQEELVLSSSNITSSQLSYDPGFALVTKDSDIIQKFLEEFDRVKKSLTNLEKLRSGEFRPYSLQKEYQDGFVELWFSPGYLENSVKTNILTYINDAEASIKVIGWVITDKEIWEALVKKSRQGVDVTLMVDDHFMWNDSSSLDITIANSVQNLTITSDSYMNILLSKKGILGVTISETFNSFIHHHMMLVDDRYLFMGTNNWSRGGFYLNDEATVLTNIPSLVDSYAAEFNRLQKQLVGESFIANYNPAQNIFETQNLPEQASTIIVYREESDPLWLGQKCGEFTISTEKISLESDCVTSRTRIFALDKEGELVASTYLQIK